MPELAEAAGEHTVAEALKVGAELVTFSGDKLFGGPQAGIVVGTRARIEPMRRHPLYRALRVDKMRVAALVATLELWRDTPQRVPVARMVTMPLVELRARTLRVRARVKELGARGELEVVPGSGRIGGGAAPGRELESVALRIVGENAERVCAALRAGDPPVIARIDDGAPLLDLRCIPPEEDEALAAALFRALP
jgi:L-seryl-tRNA(Ser) seleniumtransferase